MTGEIGRRERKKAVTHDRIADAALRLFLEHGYDAVGLRDVAAEADVAVTTVFAHFASKEALVFARDGDIEHRLRSAVTDRAPGAPLVPALRGAIEDLVRYVRAEAVAPTWRMIEGTPDLRAYEETVRARHARSLATTLAADIGVPSTTPACLAAGRFVIDAYAVAREAADPDAALDEIFPMIEAAWVVAQRRIIDGGESSRTS